MSSHQSSSEFGNQFEPINPQEAQDILQYAPIGIFKTSPEGRYLYANQTLARMYGFESPQELMDSITDIAGQLYVDPSDREEFMRLMEKQGQVVNHECRVRGRDRSEFWVSRNAQAIKDHKGHVVAYQGFNTDITARKRTEEALRESQEKYQLLIDNLNEGIWQIDQYGDTVFVNERMAEMLGYTVQEMQAKHLFDFMDEQEAQLTKKYMQRRQEGIKEQHEHVLICKDGSYIFTSLETSPVYDQDGNYIGALAGVQDITERKQAEKELRYQKHLLETIINGTWDILSIKQPDHTIELCNQAGYDLLGLSPEEVNDRKCFELIGRTQTCSICPSEVVLEGNDSVSLEKYVPELGVYLDCRVSPVLDDEGIIVKIVQHLRDITERKQLEERLRRERDLSQRYLDTTQTMMVALDEEGRITMINRSGRELLGYVEEEILGGNWFETCLPQPEGMDSVYPVFQSIMAGDLASVEYFENKIVCRDGTQRLMGWHSAFLEDDAGRVVGILSSGEDITERRKAEEALRGSEQRFKQWFESSPISLWEQDFSAAKKRIDEIKARNVGDLDSYFRQQPELVWEMAGMVRVLDINQATLKLYRAKSKEDFWGGITKVFSRESFEGFLQVLEVIAAGEKTFVTEKEHVTLAGDPLNVQLYWTVAKGHEETYSRILVSIVDITQRKIAEQEWRESEEKYRKLINTSPDAIALVDEHGRFLTVNPAMAKRFGLTQEELTGKTYHQVMPMDLADKRIMDAERSLNDEELIYFEDERQGRHLQNYYVPITPSGQQRTFQIISRDITKRVRDEEAKAEQKALLEAIYRNAPLVLMLVNSERRIQQINGIATQFARRPAEEMLGLRGGEALRCLHALDHSEGCGFGAQCQHCEIRNTVLDTLEQGTTHLQVEAAYTFSFGGQSHNLTLLVSSTPVTFQNSRMALVTIQDISERKQFEEQLKYLSLHDQLTGLYNRAYLENELYRLNKGRECPISIISVDLDGLKLVNDTLGHDHGDNLLKVCGSILQESVRDSDIVARAGGDEFVILLPRAEFQAGERIVQRIQSEIENYNQVQKGQIPLSLSIGLACAENSQQDLIAVLKQADDLMYRDKLNRNINSRSQIMTALMAALEERDFITSGHAQRLEELCLKLGKEMRLSVNQLSNLNLLAQVHDLGKVGIPDHILFKPDLLNEAEWEIMRQHPEKGHRIARASTDLAGVSDLILRHHEQWDGRGYPLGLQGEEIPIECRILAIVDSFDAMTNDRPYRGAMPVHEALAELKKNAGTQFDPQLVEAFLEIISHK